MTNNHGGPRPNSGRKKGDKPPRQHCNVFLTPETVDFLKHHRPKISEAVEELVKDSSAYREWAKDKG